MNSKWNDFFERGFGAAWDLLIDIPLPQALRPESGRRPQADPLLTAAAFPLIGFVTGLLLLTVGKLFLAVLPLRAAAVAFMLLTAAWMECKDHGRGLGLLVNFLSSRFRGEPADRALRQLSADLDGSRGAIPSAVLSVLVIFKLATYYLIFVNHLGAMLPAALILGFTMQGELAALAEPGSLPAAIDDAGLKAMRLTAGFCLLFTLLFAPLAVLSATAAAVLLATGIRFRLLRSGDEVNDRVITLAGVMVETLVLFAALLFALGGAQ